MRNISCIYKDYCVHCSEVPDDHQIDIAKMASIMEKHIEDGTFEKKSNYRQLLNESLPKDLEKIDEDEFIILDLDTSTFNTYIMPFGIEPKE